MKYFKKSIKEITVAAHECDACDHEKTLYEIGPSPFRSDLNFAYSSLKKSVSDSRKYLTERILDENNRLVTLTVGFIAVAVSATHSPHVIEESRARLENFKENFQETTEDVFNSALELTGIDRIFEGPQIPKESELDSVDSQPEPIANSDASATPLHSRNITEQLDFVGLNQRKLFAHQEILQVIDDERLALLPTDQAYCFTGNVVPSGGWTSNELTFLAPSTEEEQRIHFRPLSYIGIQDQVYFCGLTTLRNEHPFSDKVVLGNVREIEQNLGRFVSCDQYFANTNDLQKLLELDLGLSSLACKSTLLELSEN